MSTFKGLTFKDLGKGQTGLGLAKSGVQKENGKGTFVDPFTVGETYLTRIDSQTIVTNKTTGFPQMELSVSILGEGTEQKAGRLWVSLPLVPHGAELSGEEEAIYMQRAGKSFLSFLRAIDPTSWSVFKTIDKSDPKNWRYYGFDGQEMKPATREKVAEAIDLAVPGLAAALAVGDVNFNGDMVLVTKAANERNPKYPYTNFSHFDQGE